MKEIQRIFAEYGAVISEKQVDQYEQYYEMLTEKNKVMNLTAITDYEDVLIKHFLDSISIIRCVDLTGQKKLIDVGTGAGFPGIPLKILFPELQVTLMDSLNKRILFLEDVCRKLKLDGIQAVHARAEDLGRDKSYREQYDCCVSRAVANLATLAEYCIPFVKCAGLFVAYKSGKVEDEATQAEGAVRILGGKLLKTEKFVLPETDIERSLICIEKVKATSMKYPRKAGLPGRQPLL